MASSSRIGPPPTSQRGRFNPTVTMTASTSHSSCRRSRSSPRRYRITRAPIAPSKPNSGARFAANHSGPSES
jgi:hypothetical protein